MSWGTGPAPAPVEQTLKQALADWEVKKAALAEAKEAEQVARTLAFKLGFENPKEGVNRVELNNGYKLKGSRKVSRGFVVPRDFSWAHEREPTIADAVDTMVEELRRQSNEGAFIADRLVKWSADLSDKEYKALPADLKPIVDKYVIAKDGMPTLEIEGPSKG